MLASAGQGDYDVRDGHWWLKQPLESKLDYIMGSIDRTVLSPGLSPEVFHLVGNTEIGEIVKRIDAYYSRPDRRWMLVQHIMVEALYQISQASTP